MGKKKTTEQFIKDAVKIHSDKYRYNRCVYEGALIKTTITCKIHGDFLQTPNGHLSGLGCNKCGLINQAKKRALSTEEAIKRFTKVHGNTYDYSKYNHITIFEKSSIICRVHGEFKQSFNNHEAGQGCPKCGKEGHWRKEDYIKKAKGKKGTFYTIQCFNENESFYKVGITINNIEKRYSGMVKMPYSYKIISEIHGKAGFIWDLEKEEKRKLREFHYKPLIKFKGSMHECFTQYKVDE